MNQQLIRGALIQHEGSRLYQSPWAWEIVRRALLAHLLSVQIEEFDRA